MEAAQQTQTGPDLNALAIAATNHCLTGCVIGEVLGMAIAVALGWGNVPQIALAVGLAYFFGFLLTSMPLIRARLAPRTIVATALAADTVSITIMELIDNGTVILIPSALEAGLGGSALLGQHRRRLRRRLSLRLLGQPLPDRPRTRARRGARARRPLSHAAGVPVELDPVSSCSEKGGYLSVARIKAYAVTRLLQRNTPTTKSKAERGKRPVNRIANQA